LIFIDKKGVDMGFLVWITVGRLSG